MWRTIFFLLILVNLVFFAWGQGHFGEWGEGREPARLSGQIHPERLRIVSRAVDGPAPTEADSTKPATEGAEPPVAVEQPRFLVHIPPLPGRSAADRKAAEIAQLGVRDFHVVTEEGPTQFSIFFGQFGSEQAADEFLASLASKGVRSARIQAIGAAATP